MPDFFPTNLAIMFIWKLKTLLQLQPLTYHLSYPQQLIKKLEEISCVPVQSGFDNFSSFIY